MTGASSTEKEPERSLYAAAREGRLVEYLESDPAAANAVLYEVVSRVVYERLTRAIERRRGHPRCAVSVHHLEADCHDRHEDDVAAVLGDLRRNAGQRIENLEGWLVPRLKPVTIDAHRRRRGERGAQQRPRLPLPAWLDARIGHDRWLTALAVEILIWVGVPSSVQNGLWPLGAWADRRSEVTGEFGCTEPQAAADVERVLAAMRGNRAWYERYVERPLGRKQAPLAAYPPTELDPARGPGFLALTQPHELDDARLAALAAEAIAAIEARAQQGADLRSVVVEVVGVVFGAGTGAEEMDRVPGSGPSAGERVARLLLDPESVERIAAAVMDILGRR